MLSALLFSCVKTVVIDTTPAEIPTVYHLPPLEQVGDASKNHQPLNDISENEVRKKRHLGYPQTSPSSTQLFEHTIPQRPFTFEGPQEGTVGEGESLWWSFSQPLTDNFMPPKLRDGVWIMHSPSLLELKPTAANMTTLSVPIYCQQGHLHQS